MEPQNKRPSYTQDVTNKVLALMEGEGLKPWEASWDRGLTKAFNPYTREKGRQGREYRGANALNLLLAQLQRDSADPRWLTFNQAKDAGFSIRKGARAESVMFWQFPDARKQEPLWAKPEDGWMPPEDGVYQLKNGQYAAFKGRRWMKEADTIEEARNMTIKASGERKGEKYHWAALDDDVPAGRQRPKPIYSLVFNGADIVGMPPMKERRPFDANEKAERLIQATGARIEHRELAAPGGKVMVNRAFYDHVDDGVTVPPRGHFKTEGDYYRTLIHEIAHWTGHSSRLNRGLETIESRESPEYAREELRAEMASAMICAALGVEGGLEGHAAYLDSYVKLLKEDRTAIFKAARDAEKIYEAVFAFDPALRAEVEGHLVDNAFSTADPDAKKKQGLDLKKIIKADLPTFSPKPKAQPPAPVKVEPEAVVAIATQPEPEDIEIDFGSLRLGGEAETRMSAVDATKAQELDDEIGLEGFDLDEALGDTEFSDIDVGGPSP